MIEQAPTWSHVNFEVLVVWEEDLVGDVGAVWEQDGLVVLLEEGLHPECQGQRGVGRGLVVTLLELNVGHG